MLQRNRKMFWTNVGLVALLGLGSALVSPPTGPTPSKVDPDVKAAIGKPAPDFTLKDVNGKEYKLSDLKGKNIVLEWINPTCPVCNRVMGTGLVEKMRTDLKALDANVVHLAINSTSEMTAADSVKYLKTNKLVDLVALDDNTGTVGRLYGAKTTPHIFVIDAKGILRYSGAFDNDPVGKKADRINYAVNTLRLIVAGETVVPEKTESYGCAVKYNK